MTWAFHKLKIFPPKKNTGAYTVHAPIFVFFLVFFVSYSVGHICSNVLHFPAKKIRKNTAPKIHMRQFFFFVIRYTTHC